MQVIYTLQELEIHDNIHVLEYKLNILKYVRGEDQNEKIRVGITSGLLPDNSEDFLNTGK